MKSDPSEYKQIIKKLLEKTRQRRVEWEKAFSNSFQCTVGSEDGGFFSFRISAGSDNEPLSLSMLDESHNTIFRATSNDLPTSPEEEENSQMIEELYELARRQALKIEQKLELASILLDRV
jgi:hypothetical protein